MRVTFQLGEYGTVRPLIFIWYEGLMTVDVYKRQVWDYNKDVADKRESNANILLWPITQESIIKNSKLKQTEGWY